MTKFQLLRTALLGFAFLSPTIATSHADETTAMTGKVVEIVQFKLAQGVTEDAFAKSSNTASMFMKSQKGFVSRTLSRSADGTYVDQVVWNSMAEAQQAMDASMKDASLAPFMQSIDPASMKMDHQALVETVQ